MSKAKDRPTIGKSGQALPVLPPERDVRVWAKMVRVTVYTPGFLGILLLKAGDPGGFGLTVALLMLASASSIIAGLFVGSQSVGGGGDASSRTGVWSGSLILEMLAAVPILCAVPPMFNQLAHSALLHDTAHTIAQSSGPFMVGPSELLPAVAILPFMLYQLTGFGTLHYVVSKPVNWIINFGILFLIVANYIANRLVLGGMEALFSGLLVISMAIIVMYGVNRLRRMQEAYDLDCPAETPKSQNVMNKSQDASVLPA